jgi:predicted nucleic acid-binding protein
VILVLDASALITLARIGRLNLLRDFAGKIHIPEAVYSEIVRSGQGRPGSLEVAQSQWISRHQVRDRSAVTRLQVQLGHGEAEAIVLARELPADVLVLDDATARHIAEAEERKVVGLLGLLLSAKKRGIVTSLKSIVDEMVAAGFFIDEMLYRSILQQAGELP